MSPKGASGALHTNERFLFSCLSEWVRVSPSERQRKVWVPGGVRVQEPPTNTGPTLADLTPAPTPVLSLTPTPALALTLDRPPVPSTLRAWSRKPMKSLELRTVTVDTGINTERQKKDIKQVVVEFLQLTVGLSRLVS